MLNGGAGAGAGFMTRYGSESGRNAVGRGPVEVQAVEKHVAALGHADRGVFEAPQSVAPKRSLNRLALPTRRAGRTRARCARPARRPSDRATLRPVRDTSWSCGRRSSAPCHYAALTARHCRARSRCAPSRQLPHTVVPRARRRRHAGSKNRPRRLRERSRPAATAAVTTDQRNRPMAAAKTPPRSSSSGHAGKRNRRYHHASKTK